MILHWRSPANAGLLVYGQNSIEVALVQQAVASNIPS